MKLNNIKKILRAAIPDLNDIAFLVRGMIAVMILSTFGYLIYYSSTQVQAQSSGSQVVDQAALPGLLRSIEATANGCIATSKNGGTDGSSLAFSVGGAPYDCAAPANTSSNTPNPAGGFIEVDYGATGMIINSSGEIMNTQVASPAYSIQHYAQRARGEVMAADDPRSGRSVLAPIYELSNLMRNLAYSLIVVVLVISSFSILLGYLSGGEQKITLVQIMLNSFMTLVLITFFYEIAAIIYDLTVNYGNALVASVMEPFINAKVILERLQPGGDLNITAALNVFQFSGVSSAVNTVVANVMTGVRPAITQSLYGVNDAVFSGFGGAGAAVGYFTSMASGIIGVGLNSVVSGLLGSQALFDAMIAWVIFFINVKIFGNLVFSFMAFNLYVGFGPLLMLQAINQGYDRIKNTFKTLVCYGLVFPCTFMMILLGATAMNFFYKNPLPDTTTGQDTVDKSTLCIFHTNDAAHGEKQSTTEDGALKSHGQGYKGANDSPLSFRRENTEYQDVFDVTPAVPGAAPRSCRSALFPIPFTFLPAPLGNYGNRLVQVQTTDILIRTFMAVSFLIVASRMPNILKELMQVEEMKSLQGIGAAFKRGLQPVLALGAAGLGMSTMMTTKGFGLASKVPFMPKGLSDRITGSKLFKYTARIGSGMPKMESASDLLSNFGNQRDFHTGIMKGEKFRNAAAQAATVNPALKDYYYNPDDPSKFAKITPGPGGVHTDSRITGANGVTKWMPIANLDPAGNPIQKKDPVTGKILDPESDAYFNTLPGGQQEAAYNLGKQYADPVIGGSMQTWVQTMGSFQQAANGLISAFSSLSAVIEKVSGNLQRLSSEILAENFD